MEIGTALAAKVLGIDQKALDNLITRAGRSLMPPGSRGLARQIQPGALELFAVALLLRRDLGVSLQRALVMGEAIRGSSDGTIAIGVLGSLRFDMAHLRSVLHQALADAIEDHLQPRRGRPRNSPK